MYVRVCVRACMCVCMLCVCVWGGDRPKGGGCIVNVRVCLVHIFASAQTPVYL